VWRCRAFCGGAVARAWRGGRLSLVHVLQLPSSPASMLVPCGGVAAWPAVCFGLSVGVGGRLCLSPKMLPGTNLSYVVCLYCTLVCVVLVDCGVDIRVGRNPVRMQTTATPAGAVTFLKASLRPFLFTSSRASGETLDPIVGSGSGGASVSYPPWRHCLDSRGIPRRQLEFVLAATWSKGLKGAMYFGAGFSKMLPSGPVGSCNPPADFSWRFGGLHVDVCHPEFSVVFPRGPAPVVTRSLGFVPRSRAFLAGGLDEVCVLVLRLCGCALYVVRHHVYGFWVRFPS
jgi:hypothetical protein